jgi:tRNA dimethylallyltransferase
MNVSLRNSEKIPLVVILGPTAVGKSELAIELAQNFGLEIINADSMQVYRGMDIGSAKPSLKERNLVPHHLIDIKDPGEDFSAAQFKDEASTIIFSLAKENKKALVVGGTGFYIKALTKGLFPAPSADLKLREKLKEKERTEGKGCLYKELKKVDPKAASKLHPNDTFRIIRALEVFYLTGKPISLQHETHQFKHAYFNLLKIGLMRDRKELYLRIEERVDQMLKSGFLNEVKGLLESGCSPTAKPFQSLGYKQILSHLQGDLSLEEAVGLIKKNTKRYAKRQLTWFRKDSEIKWFTSPLHSFEINEEIKKFL